MRPPPLPLEEAQERLLALAPALAVEHRSVADCTGFYLAEPLHALRTQPAAAMSAMDGYAVRSGETGPWQVIGESAAGRPFAGAVGRGQAARISTGALVPDGADCVVLQEDCRREGDRVHYGATPPAAGRHVRRAGLDFREGAPLLEAGTRIGAAQLALALAAGHHHLRVRSAVRLAVFDCGDELAAPGVSGEAHRLPASNAAMLAALVHGLPVEIQRFGPVPDRLEDLCDAFERVRDADVVVTTGGASVGDHDLIRPALEQCGVQLAFWRVAMKPGKPLLVATRGSQVILGLPGNPASAFVTGYLFLLPLVRAALGATRALPMALTARLSAPLPSGGKRLEFLRARWTGDEVVPEGEQDSGALRPLAHANALIRREIGAPPASAGDAVRVYLLENGGIA